MARPSFMVFTGDLHASEVTIVERHLAAVFEDERIFCSCGQIRGLISVEEHLGQRMLKFEFQCSCGSLNHNQQIYGETNQALVLDPAPSII